MRWHVFSSFKYYASAAVALVGISAASTLLTERFSLAQQPELTGTTKAAALDDEITQLELTEKVLGDTVGPDHPKLREVRTRLAHARALALRKAAEKAETDAKRAGRVVDLVKDPLAQTLSRSTVSRSPGMVSPEVLAEIQNGDDVVTEEVLGNQTVVVRRSGDGKVRAEYVGNGPREVRSLFIASDPQQHKEVQQALDKLKEKDASDKNKDAAKEKLSSILGEQFDQDMEQRSQQIAELEKKVATLKEQIEKRKGAKSRLIELRIELLMNESEGLGFPSSWQPSSAPVIRTLTNPGAPIPPIPPMLPTPPLTK